MTSALGDVLDEVRGRVSYLRATPASTADPGAGWIHCDALGGADLEAAVAAGVAARPGSTRQVAASLLSQSYAFKVAATSLAAYAIGRPWPSPAAAWTSVVLAKGRASHLAFRTDALGDPQDVGGLHDALVDGHLAPFSALLRGTVRLGGRLVAGNMAASCAAAFRAVEGAARDRGDDAERAAIRRRAGAFFEGATWFDGAGAFETVSLDTAGAALADADAPLVGHPRHDGWFWTRTSCCLWYQTPGSDTCDDCSLIPASDMRARRQAELTATALATTALAATAASTTPTTTSRDST